MKFTAEQVRSIATPGQIDAWLHRGHLAPLRVPGGRGSGNRRMVHYDEAVALQALADLTRLDVPLPASACAVANIGGLRSGYVVLWRKPDDFDGGPHRARTFVTAEALVAHLDRLDTAGAVVINVEALHARVQATLGLDRAPDELPPPDEGPVVNPPLQSAAAYRRRAEALVDAERERREIIERGLRAQREVDEGR